MKNISHWPFRDRFYFYDFKVYSSLIVNVFNSVLTNTADYAISWRIYYNNANKMWKSIVQINQIQSEAANYCKYNRKFLFFIFFNVVPKGSMKGNLSLQLRILKLIK